MVKVTASLIWFPVEQSRSVGKKEHKEQSTLLSDECMQGGDLVDVKNHGDQWPHQARIIEIDTENKLAMIQWETT